MARPVAGVRNKTLIITLPGSPKGAKENLEAIIKFLPHACMQAAGIDSRTLHSGGVEKLERETGVGRPFIESRHHYSHDHGHSYGHSHAHSGHGHAIPRAHTAPEDRPKSNDPQAGPSRRHRESPYPMISVEEAVKLILEHSLPFQTTTVPTDTSLPGLVLAEDVVAAESVPAFRASIVDGYAVVVSPDGPSTKGTYPVVSVSHAKPGEIPPLQPGQLARITTGAPLPPGATSVAMVEDTVLRTMDSTGTEEQAVEILTDAIQPNENVREPGSDVLEGTKILQKGEEITSVGGELGLLASVGRSSVLVYSKPIVGVLSTGDEITPHENTGPLPYGSVRDSNRPSLLAVCKAWGFPTLDLGIARDTTSDLEPTLRSALQACDVLITTGGVSMGELDLLKPTLERSLGATIHFGRVAMKPGKPTTFATVSLKNHGTGVPTQKCIFSLPGNPASALVCFHVFVLPSLRKTSGFSPPELPKVKIIMDEGLKCDPSRLEYQRVTVRAGEDGRLHGISTGGQRSSRIGSLKGANALVEVPPGKGALEVGILIDGVILGRL
ncbi:MAG: hypothetical protein MMC33_007695 [Icmadophila ericetorum]|nr:hypothetical protein [Icmadophila ericetorum]